MLLYVLHYLQARSRKKLTVIQPASTLENLSRLAAKPGVQSTLILSKTDGSIIRSTGLLATSSISPEEPQDITGNGNAHNRSRDLNASQDSSDGKSQSTKGNTAEDVARMVFAFVTAANDFAGSMDTADAVKLLRLRTRKNEIVVVPGKASTLPLWIPYFEWRLSPCLDPKFLLVVFHNTPPA